MALRSPPPAGCGGLVGGPIFCGSARYQPASTFVPSGDSGRVEGLVLPTSYSESAIFPSPPPAALGCHPTGGPYRSPAELVVAHPLQAARPTGPRPSQERRVGGYIVGAVMA